MTYMELSCSKLLFSLLFSYLPFRKMQFGFQTFANLMDLFTTKWMCLACCGVCKSGVRAGGVRAGGVRAGGVRAGGVRACNLLYLQSVHVHVDLHVFCTICTICTCDPLLHFAESIAAMMMLQHFRLNRWRLR